MEEETIGRRVPLGHLCSYRDDPNKGCMGVVLFHPHSQKFPETPRMLEQVDFAGFSWTKFSPSNFTEEGEPVELAFPFVFCQWKFCCHRKWKQPGTLSCLVQSPCLVWPFVHLSPTISAISILEVWELLGEGESRKEQHACASLHMYSKGSRPVSSGSELGPALQLESCSWLRRTEKLWKLLAEDLCCRSLY